MRKTLLLTVVLLVFAAWAVAQQGSMPPPTAPSPQGAPGSPTTPSSPSAPTSGDSQASPSSSETSIEGCLGGSAPNFTVIDKAGTTYQLQLPPNADASSLTSHVGQEVRVTGTMASGSSSAPSSSSGAAGSSPSVSGSAPSPSGASSQAINVSKMSKLSDTCSSKQSNANPSQK